MERLLRQAAVDLTIRSKVEATLRSVLHDVEHAFTLEQALRNHNALQCYRKKLAALNVRYEEREALWEEERRDKERLGVLLTEEVVKLSVYELKEEKLKRDMETKIKQLELEREHLLQQYQPLAVSVEKNVVALSSSDSVSMNNEPEEVLTNNDVITTKKSITIDETLQPISTTSLEQSKQSVDVLKADMNVLAGQTIEKMLDNMEEPALMTIFAFLNPLEIMNLAQINRAMYAKINAMFGQTSEVSVEESNTTNAVETVSNVSSGAVTPTAEIAVSKDDDQFPAEVINNLKALGFQEEKVMLCLRASNGNPNVAAEYLMNGIPPGIAASAGKEATQTSKSSQPIIGVSTPMGHKRQNSGTSIATTGTAATTGSGGNPFSHMSSWFGPTETAVAEAMTAPNVKSYPSVPVTDSGEIKLNAAMASSIASKLTPTELSIILRMRERLQKCEADALQYRQEKEDTSANLKSLEAVKEFLVKKVRDAEKVVKERSDEINQAKSKALTDQEVITFLDEKVKRLEKEVNDLRSSEQATKKEARDSVSKHEKKVVVLTDMLQFERQQIASNEKEWKAAKKVLVKEVKSCRARIAMLEADYSLILQKKSQLLSGQGSPKKGFKYR